jgi:hypothetical protein
LQEPQQPSPFSIERTGRFWRKSRLIAHRQLSPADFHAIAIKLGKQPQRARRIGLVAARQATTTEEVKTRWNGEVLQDTAAPGDWVVTNLSAQGQVLRDEAGSADVYVIRADQFVALYDRHAGVTEAGETYNVKGEVQALYFPGGFELEPLGVSCSGPRRATCCSTARKSAAAAARRSSQATRSTAANNRGRRQLGRRPHMAGLVDEVPT